MRPVNALRGTTVLEMVVAAGVFLLLLAVLVVTYTRGASVWKKVEHQTSLLRELQVATRHLQRHLETTHHLGVTLGDQKLAYLDAADAEGQLELNDRGEPIWQRWLVVYVDPEGRLRRREITRTDADASPRSFREEVGTDLDTYLTGPLPDDRVLTHSGRITEFKLEPTGNYGSLYELVIRAEEEKNSTEVEKLELKTNISVRN